MNADEAPPDQFLRKRCDRLGRRYLRTIRLCFQAKMVFARRSLVDLMLHQISRIDVRLFRIYMLLREREGYISQQRYFSLTQV